MSDVRLGEATEAGAGEGTEVLALPHPDWLYHHLRVTGDADAVAAFRVAAAGAGVIPWIHDLGPAADTWFDLLVAPPPPQRRSLSIEGSRILAGQLRDAAEAHQRQVAMQAAASTTCPLDLHRLLPVPDPLLRRGPDHPETRAWLWAHWGTTWPLRKVVELPVPRQRQTRRRDERLFWVGFWSADWSPWPALATLRTSWPALRFELQPRYDDG